MRKRILENGGSVYRDGPGVLLLVDVKSSWRKTYPVFRDVLQEYADMVTRFTPDSTTPGAVTVIISGNRSIRVMKKEPLRYAGVDGRLSDLGRPINRHLMPMISDNWKNALQRDGGPPFQEETATRLKALASSVHSQGATLRFWNVPHDESVWQFLLDIGVDHINVDDLDRLQRFLSQSVSE